MGNQLLKKIKPELAQVEEELSYLSSGLRGPLGAALKESLSNGKRLRPALVIGIGKLYKRPLAPFIKLAAAVEVLHTATLIHDDMTDDSSLRRGKKTLHKTLPQATALLMGDFLFAKSVSLTAELDNPQLLKILSDALNLTCLGEINQVFLENENLLQNYYERIYAKTAALFVAACETAAILADASELEKKCLREFGQQLGTAFQIMDDILDFTGDEKQLGKPAGSDLKQGLITLPLIQYLKRNKRPKFTTVMIKSLKKKKLQKLIGLICSSGAIADSFRIAREHISLSRKALSYLPDGASRKFLSSLAGYIIKRSF
jgi:heptaprenyl diphosphate synthase